MRLSQAFFFFNDTATTEIYTLSLHDALPIYVEVAKPANQKCLLHDHHNSQVGRAVLGVERQLRGCTQVQESKVAADRKSTRLNSSHANISYAVFCLKKTQKFPILQFTIPIHT